MQESGFFKWTARINSVLFLILLILLIGITFYFFNKTKTLFSPNEVVVTSTNTSKSYVKPKEILRLGEINNVSGNDVQYMKLNAKGSKRGYYENTRNIVFFEGEDMVSHWLFENDNNKIDKMVQLHDHAENSEDDVTLSIYYQMRDEDTNKDGKIDTQDMLKIALSLPNGRDYTVIEKGMDSVLDYSFDEDDLVLTILAQFDDSLLMKKYSTETKKQISEREITRISKKFIN